MVLLSKAEGLSVGDLAKLAGDGTINDALLALEDTNLQALVLGSKEYFMAVEAVKGFSRVLAGYAGAYSRRLCRLDDIKGTHQCLPHGKRRYRQDEDP